MTKLRALLLAAGLTAGTLFTGMQPASADTDIGAYTDCASALTVGSQNTGRMACFDRITAYGPLFQVFSNWTLYYATAVTVAPRANVYTNHRWTGAEWTVDSGGTPANGYTHASDWVTMGTGVPSQCIPSTSYGCQHRAYSSDPGVLAWFHGAAADATLNVIWIDR